MDTPVPKKAEDEVNALAAAAKGPLYGGPGAAVQTRLLVAGLRLTRA